MTTTNTTCETCAHLVWNGGGTYKGHPHCGHYSGPRSGDLVTVEKTTCQCHQTKLEKAAGSIVYTSVDDAKRLIDSAPLEVLRLALQMEQSKQNRVSTVKRIGARIRRLEKGAKK